MTRHDTGRFRRVKKTSRFRLFGKGKNRRLREPSWRSAEEAEAPKKKKKPSRKKPRARAEGGDAERPVRVPRWARSEAVQVKAILKGVTVLAFKVLLLCGITIGVASAGYLGYQQFMTSDHFTVKLVRIDGTRRADPVQVQKLSVAAMGRHIYAVKLDDVRAAVEQHPWVHSARIRRELPATLVAEITEQKPVAMALLGHLYLVNREGKLFKRASADETAGLPVITGIKRLDFMNDPDRSEPRLERALDALALYTSEERPPLSEVSVGRKGAVTLYLRRGGAALRFGRVVNENRLSKLDSVLAALGPRAKRVRVVYLDNEARMDRVTVRMNGF